MKNYIIIATILLSVMSSCINEGYLGESDLANITTFKIKGQISNTIVTGEPRDTGYIQVSIPNTMNSAELVVEQVVVSPLAKLESDPYTITDFLEPVVIWVRAENDNVRKPWVIEVSKGDAPKQLAYSDMTQWFQTQYSYKSYSTNTTIYAYFPGENSTTYSPWQSPAEATRYSSCFTTVPGPSESSPEYAQMTTSTYQVGALAKSGIVTGALFSGVFRFSTTYAPMIGSDPNPRKMMDFGVPFYQRPTSVTFKMRYLRGDQILDGSLDPITADNADGRPTLDSCDVYFILQNRNALPNNFVRIAAAWLRTSDQIGVMGNTKDGMVEVTLPFIYGEPTAAELAEKPYLKIGGTYGEVVFYKFTLVDGTTNEYDRTLMPEVYPTTAAEQEPDHIIVLFSSSALGDRFWGAKDSRLDVTDIVFNY